MKYKHYLWIITGCIVWIGALLFFVNHPNNVFPAENSFAHNKTLQDTLQEIAANAIKDERATRVSVYFESSTRKDAIAINDKETYAPASMHKVLLMIAFLKLVEQDPALAKKEVTPDKFLNFVTKQEYRPKEKLQRNTAYSLEELNKRMIVDSDNEAYLLLAQTLNITNLNEVTQQLGLTVHESGFNYMNPSEFAKAYKNLFIASYLSKKNTEYALNLLSQTSFHDGLTAGVPKNVRVAHKFGERETDTMSQLHDCGIVYYPGNPYILCVMTEGKTLERLPKVIADLSYAVYSDMERQDRQHLLESTPPLLQQ